MEDIKNTPFNEEMSERVDRFLRKEMSDAESKAFAKEVKTNPELREYYQRQFNLMRGIKIENMRNLMKEKEAILSTKEPSWWKKFVEFIRMPFFGFGTQGQSGGTVVVKRFGYVYALLAITAVMVCGVFVWDDSRTRSVGIAECNTIMRGNDQIDRLIKDKRYKEALDAVESQIEEQKLLEEYLIDDPDVRVAYKQDMEELEYQRAILYLALGKKHKAKEIIKSLDDEKYKKILKELLW